MNAMSPFAVQYVLAAQRHMDDADMLFNDSRLANAGQLFGFVAECGLKALLIGCGVAPDGNGEIPKGNQFRQHIPKLSDTILMDGHLIPNGIYSNKYLLCLAKLSKFYDWSIDHRYWSETALPLHSVQEWRSAAEEILAMVDQAKADGVL